MKFGVITFPGSNCDQDMVYVLSTLLGQQVESLWHKDRDLKGADVVILPGGFSYGDYLRSGAIAKFSPIMNEVVHHANRGGIVIGICNGFQILTESGLLPGALLHNSKRTFICKNTYITPTTTSSLLTSGMQRGKRIKSLLLTARGVIMRTTLLWLRYRTKIRSFFNTAAPMGRFRRNTIPTVRA